MKITINTSTTPHTVEIDGNCTIGELTDFLSRYYGDFTWRDILIGGKGHTIHTPYYGITHPSPWNGGLIGGGGTGGNNLVSTTNTLTYCSTDNSFTNAAGQRVEITSLTSS